MSEEQKEKWYKAFTREQLIERCEYLQRSCERKEEQITYLDDENFDLENEIERLNNIINELERYINEEYIYDELGMKIFDVSKLQDKLQELKGVDKK